VGHGIRWLLAWAGCLALLVPSGRAQEIELDPALPRYRPVAGVSGVLACHGTAWQKALMTAWAKRFQEIYPHVWVRLDDESWKRTMQDGPQLYGPSTFVPQQRKELEHLFGRPPGLVPVCHYAIAVYVHKDNPCRYGVLTEELEVLLSSDDSYQTWKDLDCEGEWARRPITVYAHDLPFGFLWDHIGMIHLKDSVRGAKDDAGVVARIAEDATGMGLARFGSGTKEARESVRVLRVAPRGGAQGFIAATAENIRSGQYPLSDPFWLLINHDPAAGIDLDPLRREFLRYVLSREGQEAALAQGYLPVSAELAERALAALGVTPTGKGSWDPLLARLRERGLPAERLRALERLARRIGDRPKPEQLAELSQALARTEVSSSVSFETADEGATFRYALVGLPDAWAGELPAKGGPVKLPIGLWHVWTERDGEPTSHQEGWFPIVRENERIRIFETR